MATEKRHEKKFNRKKIISFVLIFVALIIVLYQGFIGGYFKYGYAYASCGKAPVAVSYHFGEYKVDYTLPEDPSYPGPNILVKYVCSEREAINLGAKHVPKT